MTELRELAQYLRPVAFKEGKTLFCQGADGSNGNVYETGKGDGDRG
jgi:hypothetical protein